MANILDYIKKYKNKTFKEMEFNEIDNVIFSSITYSEFKDIIPSDKTYMLLNDALIKFVNKYSFKDAKKLGFAQRDSYKIIKEIINSKRYSEVLVYGYRYHSSKDTQFCAMTFRIRKKFKYIAFEGTDHLLSGWKEDFDMFYKPFVSAHEYAVDYINEMATIFDKNLYVGGHSKGGNLAVIASMYSHPLIRKRIKRIYSNDGLGIRRKQLMSSNYEKIEDKLIQIVPDYTLVAMLLRNNNELEVIKSSRKDIMAHSVLTWQTDNNKFLKSTLSTRSKKISKSMIIWLDKHDINERKKMITSTFKALDDAGVKNLYDLKSVKKAISVIKNLKNLDEESKKILYDFLSFNLTYVLSRKNEEM